jgi:hypothetical protein
MFVYIHTQCRYAGAQGASKVPVPPDIWQKNKIWKLLKIYIILT